MPPHIIARYDPITSEENAYEAIVFLAALCVVLTFAAYGFQARGARGQAPAPAAPAATGTPAPTADPYANNAARGTTPFPLAAAAGKDSNALNVGPAAAVNSGPFDPATWKYGSAFNPPPNAKIWNPVKLKMTQDGKVTGGTLFNFTDPA